MAKKKHAAPAHHKGAFKATVHVKVRDVGQKFGHRGEVLDGKTVLHQTHLAPHGQKSAAYEAAYQWAQKHGYQVK